MEIMNQPFNGQLGSRLIGWLDSGEYFQLDIVVAFAKIGGVLRLKGALERFRGRGSRVRVFVGVDLGGTSYEALTALRLIVDELHIVHSERWQTFHSKIYNLRGRDHGLLVVGSNNLTPGGLWTNFESSIVVPSSSSLDVLQESVSEHIAVLSNLGASTRLISSQSDVDELLENNYVAKEVASEVRRRGSSPLEEKLERLFDNGVPAVAPPLPLGERAPRAVPSLSTEASSVSLDLSDLPEADKLETIWVETRAMTGGSVNQLDLSMKSLLESGDPIGTIFDIQSSRYMLGAVGFFGINPADRSAERTVTLNLDGVDYVNNRILYREANGTWRIQFEGKSEEGNALTTAFKLKGGSGFLKHKLVSFSRIDNDYYFLSIFPEDQLENFRNASLLLGWNGQNNMARSLGVL